MSKKEQTTNSPEKFNYEFNFSVKINNNILVTREFNVRKYNDKFRESIEAKELIDYLMGDGNRCELGIIPAFLKEKSEQDLWFKFENNFPDTSEKTSDKEQKLTFEISKRVYGSSTEKEVILSGIFLTSHLQPRIKAHIDIKPILKLVTESIKEAMSLDKYDNTYNSITLNRLNKITKKDMEAIYERS